MKLTMYGNKQCEREIFQISEQQVVPPDSFEVRDMTELIPTSRADSNGRGICVSAMQILKEKREGSLILLVVALSAEEEPIG